MVGVTKTVLTVGFAGFADFTDLTTAFVRLVGVAGALGFDSFTVPLPPTLWPWTTEDVPVERASVLAKITRSGILTVFKRGETSFNSKLLKGGVPQSALRISQTSHQQ